MTNGTIGALTDIAVLGFTIGAFTLVLGAIQQKKNEINFFS